MSAKKQPLTPTTRVWLESAGKYVIGEGGAALLKAIDEGGSITSAANKVGCSYKYAWDQIAEMEKALGFRLLKTAVGGKTGGGAALTDDARELLREYLRLERYAREMLKDSEQWEAIGLKISARNRISGVVKHVKKGPVTTSVKIEIKSPTTITAVITTEAAEDLELKPGDAVVAVVKATEVMIAKE
jgi:molybdate transport system regulatory protein